MTRPDPATKSNPPPAILLAGGNGTRLAPLTTAVNKHLLPIDNKPMIMHAIDRLVEWGVREVVLATRPQDAWAFQALLGDKKSLGLERLSIVPQLLSDGVVGAIKTAMTLHHDRLKNGVVVMLGDNLFSPGALTLDQLREGPGGPHGAGVVVATDLPARVKRQSGVLRYGSVGGGTKFVEKPELPECDDRVVTGLYYFDHTAWERVRAVKASPRGELEITDLLKQYLKGSVVGVTEIKADDWTDAGMDIETYYRAIMALRAGMKFYHPRFPGEEE